MFVIQVHYKVAIDIVEQYLAEHRTFLEEGYQKKLFFSLRPKKPENGRHHYLSTERSQFIKYDFKRRSFSYSPHCGI